MTFYFYANQRLYDDIVKKKVFQDMEFVKKGERGFEVELDDEDESGQEELRDTLLQYNCAWQEDEKSNTVRRASKRRYI